MARKRILRSVLVLILLVVLNWAIASWLLWTNCDRVVISFRDGQWPFREEKVFVEVSRNEPESQHQGLKGCLDIAHESGWIGILVKFRENEIGISSGRATRIWNLKTGAHFVADSTTFPECRRALREAVEPMSRLSGWRRLALSAAFHPMITGFAFGKNGLCWRIAFHGGTATVGADRWIRELRVKEPDGKHVWHIVLQRDLFFGVSPGFEAPPGPALGVPADEVDKSLAAVTRLLQLPFRAIMPDGDGLWREGKGWLRVKNGRRLLHLEGTSYEIGYQHGRLLKSAARHMLERTLYGVGLSYSLNKGRWFLNEAGKLVERQRPHIDPEYFEELRGLSDGLRLSLNEVQAVNLFPEFFHCSGVAVFNRATKTGELLHARVLDYMTHAGLQDGAVVIAVNREGALRFVSASYAGFIGSVTGMNEEQIAIGEMGGGGEGLWDGTPMSLLIRGALEHATTLEEAVSYMRDRPRTCEYYYVLSDGKIPNAVGIAATPDTFRVIHAGEAVERLPEAIDDAVLMSAGARYQHLVKRIREHYGRIDARKLFEIVRRPVAGKSNLHNVIFEPQILRLRVADAKRNEPACDQKPTIYSWPEMFPALMGE